MVVAYGEHGEEPFRTIASDVHTSSRQRTPHVNGIEPSAHDTLSAQRSPQRVTRLRFCIWSRGSAEVAPQPAERVHLHGNLQGICAGGASQPERSARREQAGVPGHARAVYKK